MSLLSNQGQKIVSPKLSSLLPLVVYSSFVNLHRTHSLDFQVQEFSYRDNHVLFTGDIQHIR